MLRVVAQGCGGKKGLCKQKRKEGEMEKRKGGRGVVCGRSPAAESVADAITHVAETLSDGITGIAEALGCAV